MQFCSSVFAKFPNNFLVKKRFLFLFNIKKFNLLQYYVVVMLWCIVAKIFIVKGMKGC